MRFKKMSDADEGSRLADVGMEQWTPRPQAQSDGARQPAPTAGLDTKTAHAEQWGSAAAHNRFVLGHKGAMHTNTLQPGQSS